MSEIVRPRSLRPAPKPANIAGMDRRVVFLLFDRMQSLDLTGPLEVFAMAGQATGRGYRPELVAHRAGPLVTSSGLTVIAERALGDCRGAIDTLVVVGGSGVHAAADEAPVLDWLRDAATRARRVTSVCTGAFLLARAGLLRGRRATTHWASCERLQMVYPDVEVQPDPIFVRDGNLYTSAGVTAGIDLALALVEEDLGRQVTLAVARRLVVFIRRPASQPQFSAGLAGQACANPALSELLAWISDHLEADLCVPALAERAFMSPRHFARVFSREVGTTPGRYVESLRLERVRMLLGTTNLQLEEIARRCGYGTVETLRRSFGRHEHLTPSQYRERHAAPPVAPGPRLVA